MKTAKNTSDAPTTNRKAAEAEKFHFKPKIKMKCKHSDDCHFAFHSQNWYSLNVSWATTNNNDGKKLIPFLWASNNSSEIMSHHNNARCEHSEMARLETGAKLELPELTGNSFGGQEKRQKDMKRRREREREKVGGYSDLEARGLPSSSEYILILALFRLPFHFALSTLAQIFHLSHWIRCARSHVMQVGDGAFCSYQFQRKKTLVFT